MNMQNKLNTIRFFSPPVSSRIGIIEPGNHEFH